VALYETLGQLAPSPFVDLNRAVAMAYGPEACLEPVDALGSEPSLRNYRLPPSVRGDLLSRLGRFDETRADCERAASLTRNARERELLLQRAVAGTSGLRRSLIDAQPAKRQTGDLPAREHPPRISSI